jgi:uncharacterized protein with von Willebrand factor type A (vWA) domain
MIPRLARWRLVLGDAADEALGSPELSPDGRACERAMSWLYDREPGLAEREVRRCSGAGPSGSSETQRARGQRPARARPQKKRSGGRGPATLTVPEWIGEVHRLFPKETIERLERDAVLRYEIHEVVTNAEVLRTVEPSRPLLEAVLRSKHLMSRDVLALATELVRRVVRELMARLARELKASFSGVRDPRRRSAARTARNFDARRTIRENLRHYSRDERRLYIDAPRFLARTRRESARWQVILLVDESGSMLGSVIHAAVTAACLWGLPALKTSLCIFDTKVVDLTEQVSDPVEVLMRVQLGGGTDIGSAVAYGASLIEQPRRALVVLVTDFFDGADRARLVRLVKGLVEQGTTVLGLAALDEDASPNYDRELARELVDAGAHVGAMTPLELADWIAERVRA